MSKLLSMMMKPKNYMYATIKGSLTDNNAVFSGFSETNYLELQQPFKLNANTIADIVIKFNTSSFENGKVIFGTYGNYGMSLNMRSESVLRWYIGNNTSAFNILNYLETDYTFSINTDYWIKLRIDKEVCSILVSTNGKDYIVCGTHNITLGTLEYNYNLTLGLGRINSAYFNGSIDLNYSYIKIANTKYRLQAVVGYTVVGSPTIVDGVVSGFSASNYLALQQPFKLNANTVAEIVIKVNIPTLKTNNAFFATDISRGIYINITGTGLIQLYVGNGTDWVINQLNGTHSLSANTNYYIKINFNNNVVTISISTDNVNWIPDIQANMNLDTTTNYIIKLGARSSIQYFNGSIDLNKTYIKINNKIWFNGQPA